MSGEKYRLWSYQETLYFFTLSGLKAAQRNLGWRFYTPHILEGDRWCYLCRKYNEEGFFVGTPVHYTRDSRDNDVDWNNYF